MRRPSRNIEIFSMSVLDMFASALGAFILMAVILFPFYQKGVQLEQTEEKLTGATRVLGDLKEKVSQGHAESKVLREELDKIGEPESALEQCKEQGQSCQIARTQTFLLISIEWDERCDVDLYVNDPAGNQFDFNKNNRNGTMTLLGNRDRGTTGWPQLSLDMQDGPGIEIWQEPNAAQGEYKVQYKVIGLKSESVNIRGWVIDRSAGLRKLPDKVIPKSANGSTSELVPIATIRVNPDGSTVIIPAQG